MKGCLDMVGVCFVFSVKSDSDGDGRDTLLLS